MKYKLLAATAAIALAAGLSPPAQANLMVSALVNGTTITVTDNGVGDTNPVLGQLGIANQTIAGVQFLGASATSTHVGTSSLNSSSFQLVNGNAAAVPISVLVGDTDYIGPVAVLDLSGGGTFQSGIGSTAQLRYWADSLNAQPAENPTDHPGLLLATDNKTATAITDSFAFNHPNTPFVAPNLYSMTLGTDVSLVAGGSLVGRTQAIVAQAAAVPEPSSLGVLGASLVGLWGGIKLRRRRHDDGSACNAFPA